MKPSELEKYCFYCQDEKAEHVRKVVMRHNGGYKLTDFEAHLCKRCNFLDDKTLSDYFSI